MSIQQNLACKTQLSPHELLMECRDPAMQKVVRMVQKCRNGDSVLVLGENGTGKEIVARALHECGNRDSAPLVILDCTNLGGDTLRSELFGHERGSFTGATDQRIGLFERANNGTAFLDEIGEVPFADQAKLLRVIQERSFSRLGGNRDIASDFRLIAATNKDLPRMVQQGTFREDLFYRLQLFTISVPPLRLRMEDLARLANHFVDKFSNATKMLSGEAEKLLLSHSWPGNVRELKNAIERSVTFADERESILAEDLCLNPVSISPISATMALTNERTEIVLGHTMEDLIEMIRQICPAEQVNKDGLLDYIERLAIEAALRLNNNNIAKTSQQLGIDQATIYRRRTKWRLEMQGAAQPQRFRPDETHT